MEEGFAPLPGPVAGLERRAVPEARSAGGTVRRPAQDGPLDRQGDEVERAEEVPELDCRPQRFSSSSLALQFPLLRARIGPRRHTIGHSRIDRKRATSARLLRGAARCRAWNLSFGHDRRIAARAGMEIVRADTRGRPVTPEVAGSSPVAPVLRSPCTQGTSVSREQIVGPGLMPH